MPRSPLDAATMQVTLPRCLIRSALLSVLAGAMLLSLTACGTIDRRLREEVFRPSREIPKGPTPEQRGFTTLRLQAPPPEQFGAPHTVELWLKRHPRASAPTLLYFHGVAGNLYDQDNLSRMQTFVDAGFSVLAVEYRGWGRSSEILPSERSLYDDAELAWNELRRLEPRSHARVLYGHSLGGAVAVEMAKRKSNELEFAALVVESTFSTLPELAVALGHSPLVVPLITLRFDSLAKIACVRGDVWVLHGDADKDIPVELGRKLWSAAPHGAHWIVLQDASHTRLQGRAHETYVETLRQIAHQVMAAKSSVKKSPTQQQFDNCQGGTPPGLR